jgi:hypothetical protein
MRSRALHFLIIAAVAPLQFLDAQLSPEHIARSAIPAVVRIVAYDADDKRLKQGSGFLVDGAQRLVTNAHVVQGAYRIEVVFANGRSMRSVPVVAYDSAADIALIALPRTSAPSLQLDDTRERPAIGASVYVVGSPLGLTSTFSSGIVSGWRRRGEQNLIQLTAPISPGSSGGPVLGARGRVIGVATASLSDGQNLNFAVPARSVATLLAAAGTSATPLPLPLLGGPDIPAPGNGLIAMLTAYPLLWGATDAKLRLGVPQEERRHGDRIALKYPRTVENRLGDLTVFVNPFTGASDGQFSYKISASQCAAEYGRMKALMVSAFGAPSQIVDDGTCTLIFVRWDREQSQRQYTLTLLALPDSGGRSLARVDAWYLAPCDVSQACVKH